MLSRNPGCGLPMQTMLLRKTSLLRGGNLEQDQANKGGPSSDGWLGTGGGEGEHREEKSRHIEHIYK